MTRRSRQDNAKYIFFNQKNSNDTFHYSPHYVSPRFYCAIFQKKCWCCKPTLRPWGFAAHLKINFFLGGGRRGGEKGGEEEQKWVRNVCGRHHLIQSLPFPSPLPPPSLLLPFLSTNRLKVLSYGSANPFMGSGEEISFPFFLSFFVLICSPSWKWKGRGREAIRNWSHDLLSEVERYGKVIFFCRVLKSALINGFSTKLGVFCRLFLCDPENHKMERATQKVFKNE